MELYDNTCRGNDAGRIVDFVGDGEMTVREIGLHIGRGTAYVRSLVDECKRLRFSARPKLVRDWVVYSKPKTKSWEIQIPESESGGPCREIPMRTVDEAAEAAGGK